jgi:hypothetical protein
MAEKSGSRSPGKQGQTRENRLKAALKANLARRKAQSRLRDRAAGPEETAPGEAGQDKEN